MLVISNSGNSVIEIAAFAASGVAETYLQPGERRVCAPAQYWVVRPVEGVKATFSLSENSAEGRVEAYHLAPGMNRRLLPVTAARPRRVVLDETGRLLAVPRGPTGEAPAG